MDLRGVGVFLSDCVTMTCGGDFPSQPSQPPSRGWAVGYAIASPTPQSNNNRTPPARRPAPVLTRFRNTAGPA